MATTTFEKKLGLYFSVDPAIPQRITGDLTRIRQILVNLAGNAVKFTSSGEVIISVRQVEKNGDDAVLEFCVKDTGVGIPNEKIGLLFKPFSQVDASTTRKFGGTGLGLAICAKLIGLMRGKIWVKSKVGIGTEFYFTIKTSYQQEEETIPVSNDLKILEGKKVLILDGNPTSGMILNSLLANLGMIPVWKQTIGSALSEFESVSAIDLVMVDNDFQDTETNKFVSEIRTNKEKSNLPLILIAQPIIADFVSPNDLNYTAKINKPLKHSQLISTVKNLLSKSIQPKSQNMNQPKPVQKINELYPLNILVAEDNAINQKLIARLFEMLGYSIHIAANGFEVLEALKRMKIDIVFMDIQMPEMDGIEATRQIIELWKEKKPMIVAMTANALYTDKEKCLAAGMDDYISKPLTINQVRAGIERWATLLLADPKR
jgi:CheY-like chemotaxis protein